LVYYFDTIALYKLLYKWDVVVVVQPLTVNHPVAKATVGAVPVAATV
jgi:hypothetical protein